MQRSSIFATVLVCLSLAAAAQSPLDCSAGPLTRSFGGTAWLVYGCSDDKTVVVMSAPGSPAAPFYFTLFQKDGRYVVYGEGTGSREATGPAHGELQRLSEREIVDLLHASKHAPGVAK